MIITLNLLVYLISWSNIEQKNGKIDFFTMQWEIFWVLKYLQLGLMQELQSWKLHVKVLSV